MRTGLLVVALVLLAGLAWWCLARREAEPVAAAQVALPGVARAPLPSRSVESAPKVVAAPKPATVRAMPRVDLAHRRQLMQEFSASGDWLSFVREHVPQARAGDVEAALVILGVFDNCDRMQKRAASGNGSKEDQADSVETLRRFCGGLLQAPAEEVGTQEEWLRTAIAQGSGLALLTRAEGADPARSQEQRVADLHAAIDSGDPTVIGRMIVENYGDKHSGFGNDRDFRVVRAESDLVLCSMGYDCGSKGPVYGGMYCQRKGCLHADGVERYYELSMSPPDYAEALAYSRQLAAEVGSGRYDWPEAQFLEKQVTASQQDGETGATEKSP